MGIKEEYVALVEKQEKIERKIKEIREEFAILEKEALASLPKEMNDVLQELDVAERNLAREMQENGVESYKVGGRRITLKGSTKYVVGDWRAFSEYVKDTGAINLLTKAITQTEIRNLVDSGVVIPGLVANTKTEIVTKTEPVQADD
jgi:hypothetical protein